MEVMRVDIFLLVWILLKVEVFEVTIFRRWLFVTFLTTAFEVFVDDDELFDEVE